MFSCCHSLRERAGTLLMNAISRNWRNVCNRAKRFQGNGAHCMLKYQLTSIVAIMLDRNLNSKDGV